MCLCRHVIAHHFLFRTRLIYHHQASRRLIPLFDRVLIKRVQASTKTAGGLLLPETGSKLNEGIVVAVGPGIRSKDGDLIKPCVAEGDNVMLPEYGGNNVKIDNDEFILYRETDLLGVLKK